MNAGIVLLALHNPLEVAECFATMDLMSGGRVIFGCALGYRDVEYQGFGVGKGEGVRRFEENLAAVKRLWTEEKVTMLGARFALHDAAISVPLQQTPHPPIWIGANVDKAVRRAARLGDCWYLNPHQKLATFARQMDIYRAELERLVATGLTISGKALLLCDESNPNLELAARNNPRLTVVRALGTSVVDLLANETVIASEPAEAGTRKPRLRLRYQTFSLWSSSDQMHMTSK